MGHGNVANVSDKDGTHCVTDACSGTADWKFHSLNQCDNLVQNTMSAHQYTGSMPDTQVGGSYMDN